MSHLHPILGHWVRKMGHINNLHFSKVIQTAKNFISLCKVYGKKKISMRIRACVCILFILNDAAQLPS